MSRQEIAVNGEPVHFENEVCEGNILVIYRPADLEPGTSWRYEEWFRGKSRRMEVQVQGRFKQEVLENPWVRISPKPLDEVNLSVATYVLCELILAVIASFLGNSFKWSFGGNGEPPHISLPLSSIMNISATPSGEIPPRLGTQDMALHKAPSSSEMQRRWEEVMPFDVEHTYTVSFFSMYIDVAKWTLANVPGVDQLSLETFWPGASMLDIAIYSDTPQGAKLFVNLQLESEKGHMLHNQCDGSFVHFDKVDNKDSELAGDAAAPEDAELADRGSFWEYFDWDSAAVDVDEYDGNANAPEHVDANNDSSIHAGENSGSNGERLPDIVAGGDTKETDYRRSSLASIRDFFSRGDDVADTDEQNGKRPDDL